jgi:hypothetical protein
VPPTMASVSTPLVPRTPWMAIEPEGSVKVAAP